MISEREISEAIDKCQTVENPTADTCRKLASYYIIRDHMTADGGGYSYAPPPEPADVSLWLDSGTEFAEAVNGRSAADVLPVIDELMTVLEALNPRLYAGVLRKLERQP